MSKPLQIKGRRFEHLKVLRFHGLSDNRKSRWVCRCTCGKNTVAIGSDLVSGRQTSCGCKRAQKCGERAKKDNVVHGLSHTLFSRTWKGMVQRCYNSKCKDYKNYGARGIGMCNRIRSSPASIKRILGNRPKSHTVDRINNDGQYSCGKCAHCRDEGWPMNIRWATALQQNQNRRK